MLLKKKFATYGSSPVRGGTSPDLETFMICSASLVVTAAVVAGLDAAYKNLSS
jgi:hypothetical protein